jgi:hypothetical protein
MAYDGETLFRLSVIARTFGARPSAMLGILDSSCALAFDAAAAEHLIRAEAAEYEKISARHGR